MQDSSWRSAPTDRADQHGSLEIRWCVFFPVGKQPVGTSEVRLAGFRRNVVVTLPQPAQAAVSDIFIASCEAHNLRSRTESVPQDGIEDIEVAVGDRSVPP